MKLYSYVVEHDNGYAPNPYFGLCTLCRCKLRKHPDERKRNIVELANEGDWVIGTGGASRKSAGHGKLVYAMRVDEKLSRWEYFTDRRFEQKKPGAGTYEQTRGDNERPCSEFEKYNQFVLISRHFYYFGAKAIDIPKEFDIEKKGPAFRSNFSPADICRFLEWLENTDNPGKHGEPCYQELVHKPKGIGRCRSSC